MPMRRTVITAENACVAQAQRTEALVRRGIHPSIAELDLSLIKMKLQDPEEGEGWTSEQCESAELEYKRYLHLCLKYGRGVVPNKIMDKFWHYHILDTEAYHRDCEAIFGHYLHHFPYFGMRGEKDAENLEKSFYKTTDWYLETFGESMVREEHMKCWHDCQSRCWHKCSTQRTFEESTDLVYAPPITAERITYLIQEKGIDPTIAAIDLEMVKLKLQDPEEGANWTAKQCDLAEVEYKRYLHLCKKYPEALPVPNGIMNTVWHYHILDTIAYHADTEKVFGEYLHHYPYFGMFGEEDARALQAAFLDTQALYKREFGEPMFREELSCFSGDIASKCVKACARACRTACRKK